MRPFELRSPSALILEDDCLCGLLIQEFFVLLKWNSQVIPHGDMLLPMLERNEYSLIVLDHLVPGQKGLELIPLIKANYTIPIIVTTAIPDGRPFLSAGANLYLEKPFGMEEFHQAVLSLT